MKEKKGFTLVELLVVIAIIALLMGILMPALARVRQVAYRMVSGTNQAGIGKAMLIYANDNEGDYPVAGSRRPIYAATAKKINNWVADNREDAYGFALTSISTQTTNITIGSCFYLLIKYADVAPKQFVNKSDVGCKEFKLSDYTQGSPLEDITEAWDFGAEESGRGGPSKHVSYSYHSPFTYGGSGQYSFPVTQQSNPSAPVVADRNPYLDINATHLSTTPPANPEWKNPPGIFSDPDGKANAACHQLEGQNVLFNDMHVKFEKLSNCGINNDNIYTSWLSLTANTQVKQMGTWPTKPTYGATTLTANARPYSETDAFLISDHTN